MVTIKVFKPHHRYKIGEHEVSEGTANYLHRMGIAEYSGIEYPEDKPKEKAELKKTKEKAENKTGNVPNAKRKKR